MVIWGGGNTSGVIEGDGGQYDPALDTWLPVSSANAPTARESHHALWTGREMLLWGGYWYNSVTFTMGPRYDPMTDTWTPASVSGAPANGASVWTGSRMIVWSTGVRSGAQYDPDADRWSPISALNSPHVVAGPTVVWAGRMMIVWGGYVPTANN